MCSYKVSIVIEWYSCSIDYHFNPSFFSISQSSSVCAIWSCSCSCTDYEFTWSITTETISVVYRVSFWSYFCVSIVKSELCSHCEIKFNHIFLSAFMVIWYVRRITTVCWIILYQSCTSFTVIITIFQSVCFC